MREKVRDASLASKNCLFGPVVGIQTESGGDPQTSWHCDSLLGNRIWRYKREATEAEKKAQRAAADERCCHFVLHIGAVVVATSLVTKIKR